MAKLKGWKMSAALFVLCAATANFSQAQTFTTLFDFDGTDGDNPVAPLVQGLGGNFYGTTTDNGVIGGYGTIFRITASGQLTTMHQFDVGNGSQPHSGLVLATDGNFYGTTYMGGSGYAGTIFKMTPGGTLTTLYSFCAKPNCTDGSLPSGSLVEANDGNFYGTAEAGGARVGSCDSDGCGMVFKLTPTGSLTTLHAFVFTDGWFPTSPLFQATNGVLYGTTTVGGDIDCVAYFGCGTVFSINMGLPPFVTLVRAAGKVGQTGGILGQGFTGATSVTLTGTPANFKVVSDTYLTATVPAGATTGYVAVTTPTGVLKSNVVFRVIK